MLAFIYHTPGVHAGALIEQSGIRMNPNAATNLCLRFWKSGLVRRGRVYRKRGHPQDIPAIPLYITRTGVSRLRAAAKYMGMELRAPEKGDA